MVVSCRLHEKEVRQIPPVEEKPSTIDYSEVEESKAELTRNKTIEPSEIKIKTGTTVVWYNKDTYPHMLMIYKETYELKDDDIVKSPNFYENESFRYTFTDKGNYLVRDVYSGTMRATIIVE